MSETFDLLDELPRGRLAIQASAGTGKTYTLAALATRFIAERDLDVSELLIVTFTRAATSDCRVRWFAKAARMPVTAPTRTGVSTQNPESCSSAMICS